jgi:hypothetical protein
MTTPLNHRYLLTRLQREWDVLSNRPSVVRRASAWQLTPRALRSLDDLLVATGLGQGAAAPFSDETMRRLVGLARRDDLAARVVLQRMLPGLSACATRNSRSFEARLDALDDLLSEAWTVIRTFPIERRERYVIKNLLKDCEYRTFVKPRRRMLVHELTEPGRFDVVIDPHDSEEGVDTLSELLTRARAAGMSDADFRMIQVLLSTATVKQAAAVLSVTDRTIRNRRKAVVRELRALADVA